MLPPPPGWGDRSLGRLQAPCRKDATWSSLAMRVGGRGGGGDFEDSMQMYVCMHVCMNVCVCIYIYIDK